MQKRDLDDVTLEEIRELRRRAWAACDTSLAYCCTNALEGHLGSRSHCAYIIINELENQR